MWVGLPRGIIVQVTEVTIDTPRLRLRCWRETDREGFAAMHADPEVMADHGRPSNRSESDVKFDRYVAAFEQVGYGRWLVETLAGEFLGCVGVMPSQSSHPLGEHNEVGWRLTRKAWGFGYATEAARAALSDAFTRCRLREVLAYTASDNLRSHAVMQRLPLVRDPGRDFSTFIEGIGTWHGLVWVTTPGAQSP